MRWRAGLLASLLTAALLPAVGVPSSAQAAAACEVTYTVDSEWTEGSQDRFLADISIYNAGDELNGWALVFDFPDPDQAVTDVYWAKWSQTGQRLTASNVSWNADTPTGGTLVLILVGNWSGSNPEPTEFTLNGTVCTTR